jgi:hypothetical protein
MLRERSAVKEAKPKAALHGEAAMAARRLCSLDVLSIERKEEQGDGGTAPTEAWQGSSEVGLSWDARK